MVPGTGIGLKDEIAMINVGMVTLGCPKNTVDSEVMLGLLKKNNMKICTDLERADAIVINTCAFIEPAKKESVDTILKINELKEKGQLKGLVVAGCLVNKYQKELMQELTEADAFIGTSNVGEIVNAVQLALNKNGAPKDTFFTRQPKEIYDHLSPRLQLTPHYTAYLKISEGCSNSCKFCSIPMMRGRNRSRSLESLWEEAQQLADSGVRELNIIGQDTTDYGTDLYGSPKLAELLRGLCRISNIKWIRLFYAFPAHLTDEMIQVLAEEAKICPYLDMPIQHTDDELLLQMNRKLDGKGTKKLIEKLRGQIPDLALRTTFIVGLPGETDKKFETLLQDIKKIRFDRLGVFTYSNEEHVPAFKMENQVPEKVKKERQARVMELQQTISRELNCQKIGKTIEVLVEKLPDENEKRAVGRSVWDGPEIDGFVYLTEGAFQLGEFVRGKVIDSTDYDLSVQPLEPLHEFAQ